MKLLLAAIGVLLSLPASAQEAGKRLNLICDGGGTAISDDTELAHGWDKRRNDANAFITRSRSMDFGDQLELWIEDGNGKVRMPRAMLPDLHGGNGGWFDIRDIKIGENEITGSVALNAFTHPKIVLDRLVGSVSVAGKTGQFNGHCRKIDPATAKRAF
jgi:hypothetical protein